MTSLFECGGYISGSVVLRSIMETLHNITFQVNDIDIYIPVTDFTPKNYCGFYVINFVDHLIKNLGLKK